MEHKLIETKVVKVGNSQYLNITKKTCDELNLKIGDPVFVDVLLTKQHTQREQLEIVITLLESVLQTVKEVPVIDKNVKDIQDTLNYLSGQR